MHTRWDELAAQLAPLSHAFGIGDLALVEELARRAGWGDRSVDLPLLPSGLRHRVPWGVSLAMQGEEVALRVFLEAQADPPSSPAYLAAAHAFLDGVADLGSLGTIAASRMWHAVSFARDRAPLFHAYACVPEDPTPGLAWLAARGHGVPALPASARVTIVSADLAPGGRDKVYALLPQARIADVPLLGDAGRAFAGALHPSDEPFGWLASYGYRAEERAPSAVALHYAVAAHGGPDGTARVAAYLADVASFTRACDALGRIPALHFVAHTSDRTRGERVTIYLQPDAQR